LGSKNVSVIGLGNIGSVYKSLSDYGTAMKYFRKALKIAEEIGEKVFIAHYLNEIGNIYEKQGNLTEALKYETKGLELALNIGATGQIKGSYEELTRIYARQKNYKAAWENEMLFKQYYDSLFNKENEKKLTSLQMQYEFDKKESLAKAGQEKKDAIALKELQKQKLVRNGFVGGFAIVLLFAGVFFTQRRKIKKGKKLSDDLLLNILPSEVAEELKQKGRAEAKQFDDVTVMFTDFKDFTAISEKLSPAELVAEIDTCFKAFDNIMGRYNIEKIKTIGDSYMAAGGLPVPNKTHATDVVYAALEIEKFMEEHSQQRMKEGKAIFELRIGIHSGPVVAGIVGIKKFAYDIWGDTVNIASRMESSGEAGKVNISGSTYELVKDKFNCSHRGKIEAKHMGMIDMYFVTGYF
jgi:class 3 adenylate cyclase